jgi:hypothetical protein
MPNSRSTSLAKTVETGSFSYHIRPISPPPLPPLLFFFYFILLTYLEEFGVEAVTQRTASARKTPFPIDSTARMADQVAGIAGGVTGTGLGGLTAALQGGLANLLSAGQGHLDRWFPPAKREEVKAKMVKFATERPRLAAFLLSQLALSAGPLALFLIMSLTVLVFALLAGIIVGVVGALFFTVFCIGLALLVLLPTLFTTTFAACFIFLWGLGAYYIVKWFNQEKIPGLHPNLASGTTPQLGLGGIPALNGELRPPGKEKDANGNPKHGEDKEGKSPSGKERRSDVSGVGDVKKKVGGVASSLRL